jgi:VWFA-related protein
MHPRTKYVLLLATAVLLFVVWAVGQTTPQQPATQLETTPSAAPATQQSVPSAATSASADQGQDQHPAPQAPNQPGNTAQVPAQGEAPSAKSGDLYVFKKEVDEVALHATVVDANNRLIIDLVRNNFKVFEDGQPQTITSFRREDIPVAMGIVIDNSGSMRDKRPQVNAAAINLVRSSNPQDKVFIVNFNEEYFLDQDYTSSIAKLQDALQRIEARGGTALFDATVASSDHLKKSGPLEKKVLLVVTDGEDNASRESLEQAIRRLQEENGPTVYTIGILGDEHSKRARRALREMAEETGGIAFFPKDLGEVNSITSQIAHDIRNQYTIVYKPSKPQSVGGYRTVKVEADAKGYKHLSVRTRSGYYAGQQSAQATTAPAAAK